MSYISEQCVSFGAEYAPYLKRCHQNGVQSKHYSLLNMPLSLVVEKIYLVIHLVQNVTKTNIVK